jgi:nucleosome assembly protein 1-like 1
MAEPIPNKRPDVAAPTPQNTPATTAPISSHAQQPGVASIKEGDETQSAASIFAQHPHLVSMIQGKLNHLVGRSSGYIESLPQPVRRRIAGLKGIQKEHSKLEAQLQEEVLELEKKYFAKFEPLYNKRAAIVNGNSEPTEEEVQAGEADQDEEGDDAADSKDDKKTAAVDSTTPVSGIPEFWLSAMKNQIPLAQIITDRDEAALKHLVDIRLEYLDKLGFKLIFEFAPNEFFTNKIITKTYMYQNGSGYGGEFIYDHAEGDKIDWKEGKNLTVIIESKKQRNKNTKQTRIIKKTVATESFFNFFSPPKPPANDDEEPEDDLEERLELDYQLGEDIKEKLIPHAIDWFTGEAMRFEELDEDDVDDAEFDEDEDDEDENMSDDHDDEDDEDDDDASKPKQDTTECKQS